MIPDPHGRKQIDFSPGNMAVILNRMIARLPRARVEGEDPLARINLQSAQNPILAFADAWAMVLDILGFYQERIANEAYVRTAREYKSLFELARLIHYKPRPGLSAEAWLAFDVEDASVRIPAGFGVRAAGGKSRTPITFETSAEFTARREWNAILPYRPALPQPQAIAPSGISFMLAGRPTGLEPGDLLLVVEGTSLADWFVFQIRKIEAATGGVAFTVRGERLAGITGTKTFSTPAVYRFQKKARLFGSNAPAWNSQPLQIKERWGHAQRGLFVYDPNGQNVWAPAESAGLPFADVRTAVVLAGGRLLIGTSQGIYRQGPPWQKAVRGLSDQNVHVLYTCTDPAGSEWIYAGCSTGIFASASGADNWTALGSSTVTVTINQSQPADTVTTVSGLPKTAVYAILRQGSLIFAGTAAGLYISATDAIQWIPVPGFDRKINALCVQTDPVSNTSFVYAGTDAGVYFSALGQLQSFQSSYFAGSPENPTFGIALKKTAIQTLAATESGVYGGGGEGLFFWNGKKLTRVDLTGGVQVICATSDIIIFSSGRKIFGCKDGETKSTPVIEAPEQVLAFAVHGNDLYAGTTFTASPDADWPGIDLPPATSTLRLSTVVADVLPGTLLLGESNGRFAGPVKIASVATVTARGFNQSTRVTEIQTGGPLETGAASVRDVTIHAASKPMPLFTASLPDLAPLQGQQVECERLVHSPAAGQSVILSGKRARLQIPAQAGAVRLTLPQNGTASSNSLGLADQSVLGLAGFAGAAGRTRLFAVASAGLYYSENDGADWSCLLSHTSVQTLRATLNGVIVGTARGIHQVELPALESGYFPGSEMLSGVNCLLAESGPQRFFAGTDNGVWSAAIGDLQRWRQEGLRGLKVFALSGTAGELLAGTENGLYVRENMQWAHAGLETLTVREIQPIGRMAFLIATTGGVFIYTQGGTVVPASTGLPHLDVRALLQAGDGSWYAGLAGGVYCCQSPGQDPWQLFYSNIRNDVTCLMEVRGSLYLGTRDRSVLTGVDESLHTLFPGENPLILGPATEKKIQPAGFSGKLWTLQKWTLQNYWGEVGSLYSMLGNGAVPGPAQTTDPAASETAIVRDTTRQADSTTISFQQAMCGVYDPAYFRIQANIAAATEGRTVSGEVLGSGDATAGNQAFALKKRPLTYISQPTAAGEKSTLEVRVNDVLWSETTSLWRQGPGARVYLLERDDAGDAVVTFGNGRQGARLPNGLENVRASYRYGTGAAGNVDAKALRLPLARPRGLKSVSNPLPAAGGTAPAAEDEIRAAAPRSLRGMNRIVSLADYRDFALEFPGIARANATLFWAKTGYGVFLTLAGEGGAAVDPNADLCQNLIAALHALSGSRQVLEVQSYDRVSFNLSAELRIATDYSAGAVRNEVERSLRRAYAFERQEFENRIAASDLIAGIQAVAGVEEVRLTQLYVSGANPALDQTLQALGPVPGKRSLRPAQILLIERINLQVT